MKFFEKIKIEKNRLCIIFKVTGNENVIEYFIN